MESAGKLLPLAECSCGIAWDMMGGYQHELRFCGWSVRHVHVITCPLLRVCVRACTYVEYSLRNGS